MLLSSYESDEKKQNRNAAQTMHSAPRVGRILCVCEHFYFVRFERRKINAILPVHNQLCWAGKGGGGYYGATEGVPGHINIAAQLAGIL